MLKINVFYRFLELIASGSSVQKLSPAQPPVPIPDVVRSLEEMVLEKPAQYNNPQFHNGHLSSGAQVKYFLIKLL